MRNQEATVCERLKRLGFAQQNQLRLYGMEFEVTSDPIMMGNDLVFVDAIEKQSRRVRRVRVPAVVVNLAKGESNAA
jgi:hypothetical protein